MVENKIDFIYKYLKEREKKLQQYQTNKKIIGKLFDGFMILSSLLIMIWFATVPKFQYLSNVFGFLFLWFTIMMYARNDD